MKIEFIKKGDFVKGVMKYSDRCKIVKGTVVYLNKDSEQITIEQGSVPIIVSIHGIVKHRSQ